MPTFWNIEKTERNFEVIPFVDAYGNQCSLQQSSLADTNVPCGASAIWLGQNDLRMHLRKQDLIAIVGYLQNWIDHGSFRDNPPSRGEKVD